MSTEEKNNLKNFIISNDEFGEKVIFEIDLNLFSLETIYKTAYWFTEKFYIFFFIENNFVTLEARPKDDYKSINLHGIAGEFSNSLLDFHLRNKIAKETHSIRDALISKAFAEGAQTNQVPGVDTNEENIPSLNDKYLK